MARPRGNLKAATGRARKQDNLSSLSTEVLRLRLQALNLPITGSKADLVSRLQAVQHPRAAPRTKPGRVQKRSARQRKDRPAESQPAVAVAVDFDGDASEVSSGSSVADLDDLLDFPQSGSRADQETSPSSQPFTETQMAAIQDTVRSSLEQALQSFPFQPTYLTNATPATSNLPQRRPGAATPLGLTRPLDKSLTDKVLRARTTAKATAPVPTRPARSPRVDPSASASTGRLGVPPVLARSRTSAVAVDLLPTPLSTAPAVFPRVVNDTVVLTAPATEARDKVKFLAQNSVPSVSTPINVVVLERELSQHPDRIFVSNIINSLRYGTHVGYTGPQKPRVSRNLISAIQHPEVVSGNLRKELGLDRVAGPFNSPPLPNLQCHPVGVVPKKHSSEWRTIYHLSYPEGDSINDHIPKDPYTLQYVRVDDAIHILQSLGPGSFMAKTDLKSAFRLIPIHPDDWHLLGIHWQDQYYVDLYLPFGLRSAPFLFNQFSDALEWILKHNYGLQHVLHILDDFFIAEQSRMQCLTSFSTLLRLFMSVGAPVVASKTLGPLPSA